MAESRQVAIAKRYIHAMWGGDLAVAERLMCDDVVFIDSAGERLEGFAACSTAARAFNWLAPNCRATIGEAFARGEGVMLRVELDAVDPRINGPYLIRVRIAGGKVCEWQTHRHKPVPYARVLRRASARFA